MPLVKILQHWSSAEDYQVGQTYDISNVDSLIKEGKVEFVTQESPAPTPPVEPETSKKTETFVQKIEEKAKEVANKVEDVVSPEKTNATVEGADESFEG